MAGDWKEIEKDTKEKYGLYLCSREWGILKESVRQRSGGICERCERNPMEACHHLTYARKYCEQLEDLQAICKGCHEFTHGKSSVDPAACCELSGFNRYCIHARGKGLSPIPYAFIIGIREECDPLISIVFDGLMKCKNDMHDFEYFLMGGTSEEDLSEELNQFFLRKYDAYISIQDTMLKVDIEGWIEHGCPTPLPGEDKVFWIL